MCKKNGFHNNSVMILNDLNKILIFYYIYESFYISNSLINYKSE